LNDNFNAIADNLIYAIQKAKRGKQLLPVLKTGLKNFSKSDYDTEEREFICDVFLRLARIVETNFANDLNSWLYGSILSAISKITKLLNPERVLATISQPCTKCDTELETFVTEKESDNSGNKLVYRRVQQLLRIKYIEHRSGYKAVEIRQL
jgi:hypothetical protein